MTLYTDNGGGPGRRPDGTINYYRAFRVWGVVERETPACWFVRVGGKVRRVSRDRPMTGGTYNDRLFTETEMHEEVWRRAYAGRVMSTASRADVDTLKRIADVLGMDCPQPERTP